MIEISSILGFVIACITMIIAAWALPKKTKNKNILTIIFIGIAAMSFALIIESLTQQIPYLYLFVSLKSISAASSKYVAIEKADPLLIAAFLGIMAGFWQELAKFFSVRYFKHFDAPWIGFGFAVVDIAFFLFGLLPGLSASAQEITAISTVSFIGIILQSPFSMMFHTGTAAYLKSGIEKKKSLRNFLLTFLAHSYVDGALDYADIAVVLLGFSFFYSELIVWIPAMIIAIVFLLYLRNYIK
jgi:hypothetical protein